MKMKVEYYSCLNLRTGESIQISPEDAPIRHKGIVGQTFEMDPDAGWLNETASHLTQYRITEVIYENGQTMTSDVAKATIWNERLSIPGEPLPYILPPDPELQTGLMSRILVAIHGE